MTTIRENAWPMPEPRLKPGQARPTAVIFDLDNCLADDHNRLPLILEGQLCDEKFESYHRMCFADKYSPSNVAVMLDEMERGHAIMFVTARPERYRKVTMWWLQQLPRCGSLQSESALFMRPNNDTRPTVEVKRDALDRIRQEGFFVERAYDDRQDVVNMYKRQGVHGVRMLIHDDVPDCEGETPSGIINVLTDRPAITDAFSDDHWPVQGARPLARSAIPAAAFSAEKGGFYVPTSLAEAINTAGLPDDQPVLSKLVAAMNTFAERNQEYKGNYEAFGASFLSLFPDNVIPPIKTVEDANRLQTMVQLHNKMMRYASNFAKGGHADSARDAIVYAAMLEEFTK